MWTTFPVGPRDYAAWDLCRPFRERLGAPSLVECGHDAGSAAVLRGGARMPDYYARFGFQPAAGVGLSDEYGGGDAFQVLELAAGRLPGGAGLVRYAPEFSAVS